MQEILASFYVGKSYGKENGFRTLYYIYVTKDKVICTLSDSSAKTYVLEYTYSSFKKGYGIDIKKTMFNRNRKLKLEKIIDNLEE